jgi:hypothetical protein
VLAFFKLPIITVDNPPAGKINYCKKRSTSSVKETSSTTTFRLREQQRDNLYHVSMFRGYPRHSINVLKVFTS